MNEAVIKELEKIQKKIADIPYSNYYNLTLEQTEIINRIIIEIQEFIDLENEKKGE